jgi:hypothetical protein
MVNQDSVKESGIVKNKNQNAMNYNWETVIIFLLVLLVFVAIAAVIISYKRHIRYWAFNPELSIDPRIHGKYFIRHVSQQEQVFYQTKQAAVRNKHAEKKRKSLQRIKWAAGGVFAASIMIIAMSVSLLSEQSETERIRLISPLTTTHDQQQVNNKSILDLNSQLNPIRTYGLVLLGNHNSTGNPRLDKIQSDAKKIWQQFADEQVLTTVSCDINQLLDCLIVNEGAVFVLLPDFWQVDMIENMLASGASVLAYDVPFQVAQAVNSVTNHKENENSDQNFTIYDLSFSPANEKSRSAFVLMENKELNTGFYPNTVLDIESYNHFYKATSSRSQTLAAVSEVITNNHSVTRLYAKKVGTGRLVWMDFSPNSSDHSATIDGKYFEGVLASVFKYLNG